MQSSESSSGMAFPCRIDIKVFMKANPGNHALVRELILELLEDEQLFFIKGKTSREGKYQSLSCSVRADSKPQIDGVFEKLTSHPEVLMVI